MTYVHSYAALSGGELNLYVVFAFLSSLARGRRYRSRDTLWLLLIKYSIFRKR